MAAQPERGMQARPAGSGAGYMDATSSTSAPIERITKGNRPRCCRPLVCPSPTLVQDATAHVSFVHGSLPKSEAHHSFSCICCMQVKLRRGDMAWVDFLAAGEEAAARGFEPHMADPDEATNILFSSGTTGARAPRGPSVLHGFSGIVGF